MWFLMDEQKELTTAAPFTQLEKTGGGVKDSKGPCHAEHFKFSEKHQNEPVIN